MLSRGKALQSSLKQGDFVPRFPSCFVKLTNIPTPLAQYSFSCPICNKEFTLEKNLIRHMKIPSNLCFHQAAQQPSYHPVNSPTYKCDICSSIFAHKNSLVKHQSKESLYNHVRNVWTILLKFQETWTCISGCWLLFGSPHSFVSNFTIKCYIINYR